MILRPTGDTNGWMKTIFNLEAHWGMCVGFRGDEFDLIEGVVGDEIVGLLIRESSLMIKDVLLVDKVWTVTDGWMIGNSDNVDMFGWYVLTRYNRAIDDEDCCCDMWSLTNCVSWEVSSGYAIKVNRKII